MAVPLRADFDAVGVRCWARRRARTDHRRGGFWRWRRFMREPVGRRRCEDWRGDRLQIVRDWVLKFKRRWSGGS